MSSVFSFTITTVETSLTYLTSGSESLKMKMTLKEPAVWWGKSLVITQYLVSSALKGIALDQA